MNYIGNCTDDNAWENIYANATDMQQSIDDSVKLSRAEFEEKIDVPDAAWSSIQETIAAEDYQFGFDAWNNVAWAYDAAKDIHYFWN
jgi:hypothetical protein